MTGGIQRVQVFRDEGARFIPSWPCEPDQKQGGLREAAGVVRRLTDDEDSQRFV